MPAVPSPAVAFLGLGLMGAPMARRLAEAGLPLTVWNRTPHKAAALAEAGAALADDIAGAVTGADIVCLCLTDAAAVESVALGPQGVLAQAKPGALIVDFSTIGPGPTQALAARAAEAGLAWLDAPVSGGTVGAAAGTLVVFCGGAAADLEAARPVFAALAAKISHLGPCGAGQAAKLCNQLIVSSQLLAIAEAMSLGRMLGVDVARLPEAFAGGFADFRPLQIFGPRMAASPPPADTLGAIDIMLKDVEAILTAAGQAGGPLGLLERVAEQYRRARRQGLGGRDLSRVVELYP